MLLNLIIQFLVLIHNGGFRYFVLYDKDKNGESWDYAYLIGDFNGWALDNTYQMKRDKETSCWWFNINDINPQRACFSVLFR